MCPLGTMGPLGPPTVDDTFGTLLEVAATLAWPLSQPANTVSSTENFDGPTGVHTTIVNDAR